MLRNSGCTVLGGIIPAETLSAITSLEKGRIKEKEYSPALEVVDYTAQYKMIQLNRNCLYI